jgi:hypothetical protein
VKDEQGAVYTEAVITLPFFIMIWAFLIFTHQVTINKIKSNAHAKGCTWAYAIGYCERANVPAGCAPQVSFSRSASRGEGREPDAVAEFSRKVGGLLGPLIGQAGVGTGQRNVARPNYIGGGSLTMTSQHSVSCNEKPKTPGELISSLWNTVRGSMSS